MKYRICVLPLRRGDYDRSLVLEPKTFGAIAALAERYNSPVSPPTSVSPLDGHRLAKALRKGLDWLDQSNPAPAPAATPAGGLAGYRDLQRQCRDAGLDPKGTAADLTARLAANAKARPVPARTTWSEKLLAKTSILLGGEPRKQAEAVIRLAEQGRGLSFSRRVGF